MCVAFVHKQVTLLEISTGSHWQVLGSNCSLAPHWFETHAPPQSSCPLGHWHTSISPGCGQVGLPEGGPWGLPLCVAQAAPGMEASVPPSRAAPSNPNALRRETSPLASPLASSSKELALRSSFIGYTLSPKGGPRQPRRAVQRHHGSKGRILGTSPIWTRFGVARGYELPRIRGLRTSENPLSTHSGE